MERVYATAQELGFQGTLEELIAMFKGEDGAPGKDGADGKDGVPGKDGIGIESMEVDENGHLIVTMTDGTQKDLGKIKEDEPAPSEGTEGLLFQKRKDAQGQEYAAVVGLGTAWETDIVIPSSYRGLPVKEIGDYAFAFYKNLNTLGVYPNISGDPRVTSLTSISIPESVTLIGNSAFYGCSGLKEITIPQSVTVIDDRAFEYCTGLTDVTFEGEQLTSIEYEAFLGCSALTQISIPKSVTVIKLDTFASCTGLRSVTLPDGLTEIDDAAFSGCTLLSQINIPHTVTAIREWSFMGCTSLESVELPQGLQSIGEATFAFCFRFCSALEKVTFRGESQLIEIEEMTFYNCTSLESITIPRAVTFIASTAFRWCEGLTEAYFEETSGWWYCDDKTHVTTEPVKGLDDATTAARCLRSGKSLVYPLS